ncbi:MAG TPA: DUF4062 domain-containing protein [Longimicrobium sp.]|jgi:hypothetical protein|uniref:DUF4062 domain-containing protein n=1 Tax=Longimicrobium sp. TaxID=2029185 RepID=UPI002ED918D8
MLPIELKEVFVSSTVRDLGDYREAVQDALLRRVEVAAYLSEDWSGGLDDTVRKCRGRLHQADAYFGIFAYWYGSVPPYHAESITHLEFKWALERWGDAAVPPIAVFMPEGEAEKALRRRAEALFKADHGHLSEADRKTLRDHLSRQLATFHADVRTPAGRWRTVNPFNDRAELRERAIVTCLRWQQKLPPLPGGRTPTDEELGQLGREAQVSAARRILSKASSRADVPAVALLVTGGEDAGQSELCSHLLTLPQLRRGRRAGRGRPSTERYELPAFVAWAAQALGLAPRPSEAPVETVDALAGRLHDALRQQQLTLLVDQVERFPGKVAGFHDRFWTPLLHELRARGPVPNRFVLIAADYTGHAESWAGRACPSSDGLDAGLLAGLLAELPALADFGEEDVRDWLDEVEVINEPDGRHDALVELALTRPGGERDGTPQRVFARLCKATLWPEEE